MFDGVQNATLSEENVSTTVVTQGNLELPLPLNSLDLHEKMKKMNQMKFWTGPTSSFPNIFETMDSMLIGLQFSLRFLEPYFNTSVTLGNLEDVGNFD